MEQRVERCDRLRRLHDRLTEELRLFKETREEMDLESFDNPTETVNVIKSLQETLTVVDRQLEECLMKNA